MNRNAQKRRGARQGRNGFVLALLAVFTFLVLLVLSAGLFFKVSEVAVAGNSMVRTDDIRKTAGISEGDNLFLINKFDAYRALFSAFPYIKNVSISRSFPSKVVITVTESVPACAVASGGMLWILDRDGRILEARLPGAVTVPLVTGTEPLSPVVGQAAVFAGEEQEKGHSLFAVLRALENLELLSDINAIDISKAFDVRLTYQNRLEVIAGYPNDLEYKLSYIKPSAEKLEPEQKAALDVSSAREKNVILMPKD